MDIQFTIKRGNPFTALATLTYTSTGAAIDLSGCTILFTAKRLTDNAITDTDAEIKSEMTVSEPTSGTAYISLETTDTAVTAGIYKCDIRVYKSGTIQENTDEFYIRVENTITSRVA